ncbi:hypothetical protein GCM10027051_21820 [Niabella terrae]
MQIITEKDKKTIIIDSDGEQWHRSKARGNVTTNWFGGFDLGFANFVDHTAYGEAEVQAMAPGSDADWFDLRNGKSVNVNLWVFSQKINLVNHVLNLKYALGLELNNYRFKNPVRFNKNSPVVSWDATEGRSYSKNKLAADYVTLPLMLNFDFAKGGHNGIEYSGGKKKGKLKLSAGKEKEWGFSVGLSAGYLYTARNKFINSDEGKQKVKDNFNLRPWKIAYVAEINLGYISLFGSYAQQSMFKKGLDLTPYAVGLRF